MLRTNNRALANQDLVLLQAFRDYQQELLLHKLDEKDTTIAHVAAKSGNIKLFKVHTSLLGLQVHYIVCIRDYAYNNSTIKSFAR